MFPNAIGIYLIKKFNWKIWIIYLFSIWQNKIMHCERWMTPGSRSTKISKLAYKIWKNKTIDWMWITPIWKRSIRSKLRNISGHILEQLNINLCLNCSLTTTNESLEEKLEDVRKQIEELNREVEIERRKNERLQIEQRTKREHEATNAPAPSNTCSREPDVSNWIQSL